jgi:hypothetical protein
LVPLGLFEDDVRHHAVPQKHKDRRAQKLRQVGIHAVFPSSVDWKKSGHSNKAAGDSNTETVLCVSRSLQNRGIGCDPGLESLALGAFN